MNHMWTPNTKECFECIAMEIKLIQNALAVEFYAAVIFNMGFIITPVDGDEWYRKWIAHSKHWLIWERNLCCQVCSFTTELGKFFTIDLG